MAFILRGLLAAPPGGLGDSRPAAGPGAAAGPSQAQQPSLRYSPSETEAALITSICQRMHRWGLGPEHAWLHRWVLGAPARLAVNAR